MKLGLRSISSNINRLSVVRPGFQQDLHPAQTRGTKHGAKLDPSLKWDLTPEIASSRPMNTAKLPGNVRVGAKDLPLKLTIAINRVLMKFDPHKLRKDAVELRNVLVNRKPPAQAREIRIRATEMEREIFARENITVSRSKMSHEELLSLEKKVKAEVFPKLRAEFHNWIPLDYTPYVCAQYLVNRFPEEYGVLTKIFSEMANRVPDFAPESLLDFGSGVGTVPFAASALFKSSMKEYYCVDIAPEMIKTAKEIVENGTEGVEPLLTKTYFRQHLPGLHDRKYDLVVSAYSLMELPSTLDRLKTLRSLWQKTGRFLVIVELGTSIGYQLIMEARDHLLGIDKVGKAPRKGDQVHQVLPEGHVFSPCPHDLICPRQSKDKGVMCHFPISFQPLPFMTLRNTPYVKSRYSYLVLEKTTKPRMEEQQWPRVVEDTLQKKNHAICRLCCADGKLHEVTISPHKHPLRMYRTAKHARWGDRLPFTTTPKTEQELQADEEKRKERLLRIEEIQATKAANPQGSVISNLMDYKDEHDGDEEKEATFIDENTLEREILDERH